jgi:hypothetical protein
MVVSNGALRSIFLSFIEFMILIMFLLLPGCSMIRVLLSWKLGTQLILFVCILIPIISVPNPNPNPHILTLILSAQKCGLSIVILFVFDLCFLLGYMICLGQHAETILNMYPQHSHSCNVPSELPLSRS